MDDECWLQCNDPERMLDHLLEQGVSRRRLVLFACACLTESTGLREFDHDQLCWDLIRLRAATVAGDETPGKLALALESVRAWRITLAGFVRAGLDRMEEAMDPLMDPADAARIAMEARLDLDSRDPLRGYVVDGLRSSTRNEICRLLREMFHPDPGARVPPDVLEWNARTIPALARTASENCCASSSLSILADALEEAGCQDEEMIEHLREPWGHRRGCWAVERILESCRIDQGGENS
jgi:hypothetical protein